tara:strand:- start:3125 stop:3343 length:219 start_codon:yes stop_codon:yes gene_type:complete
VTKKINLDAIIIKQFPTTLFGELNDEAVLQAYRAYSLGFKEGYGLGHPGDMIEMGTAPTLGEKLHAAQQEKK